jgi:hypothetical protein
MKRFFIATVLLAFFVGAPTQLSAQKKQGGVDMRSMNHIFVGWVGFDPDQFMALGYSKRDWLDVIDSFNAYFRNEMKKQLPDKTFTMAKDKDDVNAAGNDLYIKFSDVEADHKYRLHLAIHFIDPKTNTEIETIPSEAYVGRVCTFEGCMEKSLNKISELLKAELTTVPKSK